MVSRKGELMEATINIIAEKGLAGFSMKQVTTKVGCSEALIYKHFSTKEKLLYSCFEQIHMQIAHLFDDYRMPENITMETAYGVICDMWKIYFRFLVSNGNNTMFYFAYRDSAYVRDMYDRDNEAQGSYFKPFMSVMGSLDSSYGIMGAMAQEFVWTFVLDTTGTFAKRVIRGELPNTEDTEDQVFYLLFKGIYGLFDLKAQ